MKRLVRGVRHEKPRGELYIYSSWRASYTKEPNTIFLLPRPVIFGRVPQNWSRPPPPVLQDGNLQLLSVRTRTGMGSVCRLVRIHELQLPRCVSFPPNTSTTLLPLRLRLLLLRLRLLLLLPPLYILFIPHSLCFPRKNRIH